MAKRVEQIGTRRNRYRKTANRSRLAISSLGLGILGLFPIGVIALSAVVTGALALMSIRRSEEGMGGKPFAIAGILLGLLGLVIFVIVLIASLSPGGLCMDCPTSP